MSDSAAVLRLQVAPEPDALEPARLAVLAHLAPYMLSAAAVYAIELVLEEVLSNQIKYAFTEHAATALALSVDLQVGAIVLGFEDDGRAFDPLQAAAPAAPTSIDEARVGGLGLVLVQRFAASARYERVDGRNRLTVAIDRAA